MIMQDLKPAIDLSRSPFNLVCSPGGPRDIANNVDVQSPFPGPIDAVFPPTPCTKKKRPPAEIARLVRNIVVSTIKVPPEFH